MLDRYGVVAKNLIDLFLCFMVCFWKCEEVVEQEGKRSTRCLVASNLRVVSKAQPCEPCDVRERFPSDILCSLCPASHGYQGLLCSTSH